MAELEGAALDADEDGYCGAGPTYSTGLTHSGESFAGELTNPETS